MEYLGPNARSTYRSAGKAPAARGLRQWAQKLAWGPSAQMGSCRPRTQPRIGSPGRKHDPTQRPPLKGAFSPTGGIFPRDGRTKVDFRICNVELSRELPATPPAAVLPSELLPSGRGGFRVHSHSLWRMGGQQSPRRPLSSPCPQRIPRVAHCRHRSNDENSQGRI